MRKTAGIIATLLTSLLCGLPGLFLTGFGLLGLLGTALPGTTVQTSQDLQDLLLGEVLFIGGGIILIIIPIVVGILSLRKKRVPAPVYAAPNPQAYAAPAQSIAPLPPQVSQAVPQPVAPPPPQVSQAVPQPVAPPPPQVSQAAPQPVAAPAFDPARDLYARLMALNRPTAPYRIVDGRAENVDLIAEWKIVDAQWYEVFAKANLTKVFRIYLKFDPARQEVRAMDREFTVSWRAGVPSIGLQASVFKGQKSSVSFGIGTGFTENYAPGVVYKYKFNTNEIKQPIQQIIASVGWSYKGVAFGKL